MSLLKLISRVVRDNISAAAVISRRVSSRVVLESTMESRKRLQKYGGVEEILKAFDEVENLERRIFGYYSSEDTSPMDSSATTEQKQGNQSNG